MSETAQSPRKAAKGLYRPREIEKRWQARWEKEGLYRVSNPGEPGFDAKRPKYYVLDMFPYPSGAGLHVGHPLGYIATDIFTRYKRMRGFNVLHPMGFDAFGLPAEQYAIQTNIHPKVTTQENIATYRRQLRMLGLSYDWSREIATIDPPYYKFTQWIFKQMFLHWYDPEMAWTDGEGKRIRGRARPIAELQAKLESGEWSVSPELEIRRRPKGTPGARTLAWNELTPLQQRRVLDNERLAFLDEIPVNWCPALGTVLSNEEVDGEGRSERGGFPVYRRPLKQWMMRITAYADRLLADLGELSWPESVILMQRNWIGRSTGAEVFFPLDSAWVVGHGELRHREQGRIEKPSLLHHAEGIRVYTTRPDTLYGATYMVLAPEHPLIDRITTARQRSAVESYREEARHRSDLERTADAKEKTGVFTGAYAINPVNGERIPIWVADYVLMGYGTGAIMAVPAGDGRDYAFARKFGLPIRNVVTCTPAWIAERLRVILTTPSDAARADLKTLRAELAPLDRWLAENGDAAALPADRLERRLAEELPITEFAAHRDAHPELWGDAFTDEGVAVNSPSADSSADGPVGASKTALKHKGVCSLNGLPTPQAKEKITAWLEETGLGRDKVQYKLRDWVFSRQKYWGEPFPVLHGPEGEIEAVADEELPVELPEIEDFKPTPVAEKDCQTVPAPPLSRAKEWVVVHREGREWRRDVNTMPQWAGSCWYYLRFIDPKNNERFCDPKAEQYWMPVDLYVGGAEHAVLHLLYARFWHKFLFDLGLVSTREPFKKLFNQGMVQSFAYRNGRGLILSPEEVEEREPDRFFHKKSGELVQRIVAKMSKSLKNVVNPDEILEEYGADTFRLYEMFMGPLDASKPWNTRDVPGLHKLCARIWRLIVDEETGEVSAAVTKGEPNREQLRVLHRTLQRVTEDLEALKFNTAIAALFDYVNAMTPQPQRPRAVLEPFIRLIAPFTPHLAEELRHRLGHKGTVVTAPWPEFDPALTREEEVEIAVQIVGKVRHKLLVPADADDAAVERLALADPRVKELLEGKTVRKIIVVKGRLINFVVA